MILLVRIQFICSFFQSSTSCLRIKFFFIHEIYSELEKLAYEKKLEEKYGADVVAARNALLQHAIEQNTWHIIKEKRDGDVGVMNEKVAELKTLLNEAETLQAAALKSQKEADDKVVDLESKPLKDINRGDLSAYVRLMINTRTSLKPYSGEPPAVAFGIAKNARNGSSDVEVGISENGNKKPRNQEIDEEKMRRGFSN